jgi:hypothetical protein
MIDTAGSLAAVFPSTGGNMTAARLPETDYSPLLRTDFTDDTAWQALLDEIDGNWVTVLADPTHRGLSVPELVALVPDGSHYPVLVVADDQTFSAAERSLLLIDVREEPGRTFRVGLPDAFQSVIGNLAIANASFDEYLDSGSIDDSGTYRLSDRHRQALASLQGNPQPDASPHVVTVKSPSSRGAMGRRPAQ